MDKPIITLVSAQVLSERALYVGDIVFQKPARVLCRCGQILNVRDVLLTSESGGEHEHSIKADPVVIDGIELDQIYMHPEDVGFYLHIVSMLFAQGSN